MAASAFVVSVGVFASPASAQLLTAVEIYGAGASLPAVVYRQLLNCYGQDLRTAGTSFASPACTAAPNTASVFTYASVGSGAGLSSFIFDDPTRVGLVPTTVTVPYANQDQAGAPVGPVPTFDYDILFRTVAPTGFVNHHWSGSDATIPQSPPAGSTGSTRQRTYDCYQGLTSADPTCTVDRRTIAGPAIQVPTVTTTVNVPFNLPGRTVLKLSRVTLCGIFTGSIIDWNDARISADNGGSVTGGVARQIRVITRADSSGTTFLFTQHLDQVCDGAAGRALWPDLAAGGGTTTLVGAPWTRTLFYRAPNNEGVAQTVASTPFAIGYVTPELTRPAVTSITVPTTFTITDGTGSNPLTIAAGTRPASNRAAVQNRALAFVLPTPVSGRAALASAVPPAAGPARLNPAAWGAAGTVADPAGAGSYPISGFTWYNGYTCYASTSVAAGLRGFWGWFTDPANAQVTGIVNGAQFGRLPTNWQTAVRGLVFSGAATKISGVTEAGRAPVCTGKTGA